MLFDEDGEVVDLVPQLRRRIVWDMFPHEEIDEYFKILSLIPSGSDVSELEHKESHQRTDRCGILTPYIEVYVTVIADILSKVLLTNAAVPPGEETESMFSAQNLIVIRHAVYSIITQMIDTKVLSVGDGVKRR